MGRFELQMTADAVNALMLRAFPDAHADAMAKVVDLAPGRATLVRRYGEGMLRPGGLISGPNLMGLADTGAYALILAHVGEQLMAVTSQLTMNFLRGAKPGDLHAEAELLHLGRRSAVCDVRIWTESPDRLAAQANVTYALPLPKGAS
ncbi:PaaI family thioesterase [Phenylobacterium sp.]|jgi:uncharacterized protein (TIGR00369 family)|uniref:PaaI family thioesterase n=1 Tax=Phenylobacterium sp. TaxID=1871053 RepID=UPI002F9249E9